ncbi:Ig-like domain-containing protein [Paenibacillus sp. CC-CFT747]|nr:Ig-like domain-containing protein [Paenibacillus sp. CC-CFT747]
MRKIVSLLMVVSMICTFLPVGARISRAETGSANLFANGGFEQTSTVSGWSGNLAPTGWTRYVFSGSPVFAVDKSVSHSGSQSVRIEASSPSRGTVYQQIGSVTAGRTYKISGWMKTENVSNQALIRYQIGRTSGGNVLINFVTATGTKDWFYFEKTLTMPDNATSPAWLKLEAFLETGTGKVWFDDLAIQEWTGVQGVTLQPSVLSLQKGETARLQPEFLPAEASNRSVTWISSNPDTVSVSAYGDLQALADGYSVITVKTEEGGFTDHSVVSVGAPASLSAEPFSGTVEEDGELKGQLKASDSTGTPVTFGKAVDPQNGKLTVFPDGRFLYYPNPDFTGKDEFLFTASTGTGGPKFAEAAIQVTPVNDPPVLDLSWVSTGKNKALTGKLSIASDPEKDIAAWSLVTGPAHGTFELKSDGAYTYTPNGDYTGYDKIRVAAVDGKGGQSEAEFRVYVIPSGEDFIAQFRSQATYGQHPRLLADKPAIESTKRLIGSDPDVTQWFETLKKETEPLLGTAPTPYASNGANNGAIRDLLIRLGVFYQFSGDSRYAARAIQELEALAAFPDWGARTNNILAMAELSFGVSLAYDLVYEAMTPEQRTLVADAIRVKTLGVALDWYNGVFTHNGEFNNINLVDNGNFGFAAMAIADENPEAEAAAAAVLQGMYKKLQQSLRHYTADGAWPEGPAYWHYGGQYLTYMIAALNNTLGKDYGLSTLDGFEESGTFPYHLLGEKGFFDFYDGGISMAQPESMWFADFFQRPEFSWHLGDLSRRKGVYSPLYLMLYKPGMFNTKPVELDKFYSAIESGSMRSAWDDPDALFASMKGLNETLKSHNDLDAGTFVFDALGERWAMDTGNEDYSLPGYWDMKYQRWTLYRKKRKATTRLSSIRWRIPSFSRT